LSIAKRLVIEEPTIVRLRTKVLLAGLVLAGAVGYLAYAGLKSGGTYYLQVDTYLQDPQYHGKRVRLHGKVGLDDFQVDGSALTARFQLAGETAGLPVVYHGSIPDLFKVGCEVVVEGRLNQDGVFQADQLLTKCASKYAPRRTDGDGRS
jgi:cytochrome c-type biogenesis protein CcmE